MDSLVSTQWLAGELGASDLRVVDASYHLPQENRDARAEYEAGHIPGAVFLDLDSLVDPGAPFDNTLPSAEAFAERMTSLGIAEGNRIVLYDDASAHTSARAWFMLRLFGARHVAVLDGGLAKWKAEGRPLSRSTEMPDRRPFAASLAAGTLRTKADLLANLARPAEQVVDARAAPRFAGEQDEPRPGIGKGHIPGARNVAYARLFNSDGTFKDPAGVRAAFEEAGVDLAKPLVTSCGSGISACVLSFALHLIGKDDVSLYDGSWGEWGADPETPKELGHGS
ncbi:MAG: 3-mercaptopyruvate sulfurtransferase [Novosphingobium sp.]|nr:3-mercaptopyruvate sulfurtransferase [Novosphingobium sp.]